MWQAYIPNTRLRELQTNVIGDRPQEVQDQVHPTAEQQAAYERELRELDVSHVATEVKGGSETHINDPNLQRVVDLIKQTLKIKHARVRKLESNSRLVMSTGARSEYCVAISNRLCLGTEAKGRNSSNAVARSQSFSLGTEIAIELLRSGVSLANCAVPIIVSIGDGEFQVFGVYLMKPAFPVMTELSRTLKIRASSDREELVLWIFYLAFFIEATARLSAACREPDKIAVTKIRLRLNDNFFKPIYDSRKLSRGANDIPISEEAYGYFSGIGQKVDNIMEIYKKIASVKNSENYFLFPKGLLMLPNENDEINEQGRVRLVKSMKKFRFETFPTNTPLIVFPLLAQDYTNKRPPKELVRAYLRAVRRAIQILEEAGVCHADLRPQNILWRRKEPKGIEIQIIDFEDAELFGRLITFYQDIRYPHSEIPEKSCILASAVHNKWFLASLLYWLRDGNMDFDNYMYSPGNAGFISKLLRSELDLCVFPAVNESSSRPKTRKRMRPTEQERLREVKKRGRWIYEPRNCKVLLAGGGGITKTHEV